MTTLVRVRCRIVRRRKDEIGVTNGTLPLFDGEPEKIFWLPRSQILVNRNGTISMPEHLAKEVGLA